jgi:hypothetical protein
VKNLVNPAYLSTGLRSFVTVRLLDVRQQARASK